MARPTRTTREDVATLGADYDTRYGFSQPERHAFRAPPGLSEQVIRDLSAHKQEPEWMLQERLEAYRIFQEKPVPSWGNTDLLSSIDLEQIHYYIDPTTERGHTWEEVPEEIRDTFERLGIPEAERRFLAGVSAQYESEVVYHSLEEELRSQGVVFLDMDGGLREHPEIVREHFGTIIPAADNRYAALNTAVWSGGSFIYVPPGVQVTIPLQAYFRINARNMGQFERTLIIADEGSSVHYIEGCTAPTYTTDSLHAAVVELRARPGATIRYTTIQNWSRNIFNLVTKRAVAEAGATVQWVDGNLGSRLTMKYPSVYLTGPGARGEVLSIAYAGDDQHQDAGAKMVHAAPDTTSQILSRSISRGTGRSSYRGLVKVHPGATGCRTSVRCDALLLGAGARSDTYPTMEIEEQQVIAEHEATVSRVGEEQLFYLQSRGLDEEEATALIVNGFLEPFTRELPMEYAVELNRLIQLEMEGAVG